MLLLSEKAYDLLKKYKLPVVKYEYISEVSSLKVPCVLKVPEIVHKTEAKAVRIVNSKEELQEAYRELSKKGKVVYQPFVEGQQLIIGINKDPTFKQVIMFGLGGVYTEVFKDVIFRVCPISESDVDEMISELKSKDLLFGFRGSKPVKISLLKKILVDVSKLAIKEDIFELDINPLIVNDKSAYIVDARIVK